MKDVGSKSGVKERGSYGCSEYGAVRPVRLGGFQLSLVAINELDCQAGDCTTVVMSSVILTVVRGVRTT